MIKEDTKKKEKKEYSWPENYYMEFDPVKRLEILNDHKDAAEYDFMKDLYFRRYLKENKGKNEKLIDNYMKSWVFMRISASDGLNFLNRNRKIREYKAYLLSFTGDYANLCEENRLIVKKELISFFMNEINLCLTDKNYRSTIFGLLSMKEETLNKKIVNELNRLTETFPEELGLKDDFKLLNACAEEAYKAIF